MEIYGITEKSQLVIKETCKELSKYIPTRDGVQTRVHWDRYMRTIKEKRKEVVDGDRPRESRYSNLNKFMYNEKDMANRKSSEKRKYRRSRSEKDYADMSPKALKKRPEFKPLVVIPPSEDKKNNHNKFPPNWLR